MPEVQGSPSRGGSRKRDNWRSVSFASTKNRRPLRRLPLSWLLVVLMIAITSDCASGFLVKFPKHIVVEPFGLGSSRPCSVARPPQQWFSCFRRNTQQQEQSQRIQLLRGPYHSHRRVHFRHLASVSDITTSSASSRTEFPSWGGGSCEPVLAEELPEGFCVGVRISTTTSSSESGDSPSTDAISAEVSVERLQSPSHWIRKLLHPQEIEYSIQKIVSDANRQSFLLGRLALRQSLIAMAATASSREDGPADAFLSDRCILLKDEYGRPRLPDGYFGSISHKHNIAVGLVCRVDEDAVRRQRLGNESSGAETPVVGIGVDLEVATSKRGQIARRILTKNELQQLTAELSSQRLGMSFDEEVLLRFSIKESLYKAMHPLICQYVGFREVEVEPHRNGTATVIFNLESKAHEQFALARVHWRRVLQGTHFLTSARIELAQDRPEECFLDDDSEGWSK